MQEKRAMRTHVGQVGMGHDEKTIYGKVSPGLTQVFASCAMRASGGKEHDFLYF